MNSPLYKPSSWFADYLYSKQCQYGGVRGFFFGDSIEGGAGYNQGLIVATCVALAHFGIEVLPVGSQADATGNWRFLRNSFGGNFSNHSFGGRNTDDLVNAKNGVTQTLADALTAYSPDVCFGCFGTNDASPPAESDYLNLFRVAGQYDKDVPWACVSPFNSNDTNSNLFSNTAGFDSQRFVIKEALRTAIRKQNHIRRVMFTDGMKAMGLFTRYQNHDLTGNTGNANAVFYDGTHPAVTGNAMLAAMQVAEMFGVSPHYVLELMAHAEPYSPIDLSDAVDITAGNSASWGTAEDLKHVLMSLTVTNIGAVTATATVYTSRYKQDLSASSDTARFTTLKVPAGATRGWTFPCPGPVSKYATGPVAWYNERFKVAIAGADCNVALSAKRMLV